MLKFIILVVLSVAFNAEAQLVLVPERSVPIDTYLKQCQLPGYICTQDYFKSELIQSESVAFESFLEQIDIQNEDYRRNLFGQITRLLREENINLEQAELLVKIISKIQSVEKKRPFEELGLELKDLITELENLPLERSESEAFLILKKIISKKQYSKLRYKIKSVKVTRITPYTAPMDALLKNPVFLINGFCEKPEMFLENTSSQKFMPYFSQDCEVSTAFAGSSEINWSNYQKPMIYTLIAAAAILLLHPYQLEIEY